MDNGNRASNRNRARIKLSRLLIAGLVGTTPAWPALSQQAQPADRAASDSGLEEILVTASRRTESSQSVPISLTAVGADELAKEGITSASQLGQLAPSLYVLTSVSEGSPRVSIRGLTGTDFFPAGSPAVATYIDDVYQAFQFGIASSLFDLQRVEVLRGPQGTTFGKNTTGGAVAYFSQEPVNSEEGYVSGRVAGGNQPQRFIEGAINIPLIDNVLAMRVSGRMDNKSNYVYDQSNNVERGGGSGQAGRFQLGWTPNSDTKVNLTVFSSTWNGDEPLGYGQVLPGTVNPNVINLSAYNLYDDYTNNGVTLRVQQALGLFSLSAISHYRRSSYETAADDDGLGTADPNANVFGTNGDIFLYTSHSVAKQYGQEFRLASDTAQRLSGIMGVYYEHDRVDEVENDSATIYDNYNAYAHYSTKTETYAAFGNFTVKFTDALSFTGGVRKTVESRKQEGEKLYFVSRDDSYRWTQGNIDFTGPPPIAPDQDLAYGLRVKAKPGTWDGTLNYNPMSSLLVFARVAEGFRSGGFNPASTAFAVSTLPVPTPPTFQGESVRSYEIGIKSSPLDILRVNASVFHYDYSNQQVTDYLPGPTLPFAVTDNAGKAKVDGGELELLASTGPHWQYRGSTSYTNARYTQYVIPGVGDYTGNTLQQAPKWTANVSVSNVEPLTGKLDLRTTSVWSYRSRIFFDSSNDPYQSTAGVAKGSIRVGIEPNTGKGFSVTAFADNVTNKRPLASDFAFVPGFFYLKYFETGRLYGVDLSYHW